MTEYEVIKAACKRQNLLFEEERRNGLIYFTVKGGYTGFHTVITFSEDDGRMLDLGAYE